VEEKKTVSTRSGKNDAKSSFFLGQKERKSNLINELLIPALLMSSIGAFYWAIRGSSGYGGSSGGAFAGIGWGIAWFFFSYEKSEIKSRPYSSGWLILAITLGISIGGMHGYGQFMSWIRGIFYLDYPSVSVHINPMVGYLWLFQCGLAWGGNAGLIMGWCGSKEPPTPKDWILRLFFGIGGALIAYMIAFFFPGLINPLYDIVDYTDLSTCRDCARTLATSLDSMLWLGLYFGLLLYEVVKKDWRNVKLGLTMGLGFALSFSIFAFWHYGSDINPYIDWWKNWEMSIGFFGGVTFGICFYLFNRPVREEEIKEVKIQPYSANRNAEKLIGAELAITLAIGWAIYNGISGFGSNFDLEEIFTLLLTIALIVNCVIYLLYIVRRTIKNPYNLADGRSNINKPAFRFLVVHSILIVLGYMVSFNSVMSYAHWVLIIVYTVLLIIGVVPFLIQYFAMKREQ